MTQYSSTFPKATLERIVAEAMQYAIDSVHEKPKAKDRLAKSASALEKYLAKATVAQFRRLGEQLLKRTNDPKSRNNITKLLNRIIKTREAGDVDPDFISSRGMSRLVRGFIDPAREGIDAGGRKLPFSYFFQRKIKPEFPPRKRADELRREVVEKLRSPAVREQEAANYGLTNRETSWDHHPLFDKHLAPTDEIIRAGDLPYDVTKYAYRGMRHPQGFKLKDDSSLVYPSSDVFVSPNASVATMYSRSVPTKAPYVLQLDAKDLAPVMPRTPQGVLPWTGELGETEPRLLSGSIKDLQSFWGKNYELSPNAVKQIAPKATPEQMNRTYAARRTQVENLSPDVYQGKQNYYSNVPLDTFNPGHTPYENVVSSLTNAKPINIYRPISGAPAAKQIAGTSSNAPVLAPESGLSFNPHILLQRMQIKPPFGNKLHNEAEKLRQLARLRLQHGAGESTKPPSKLGEPTGNIYVPEYHPGSGWSDVGATPEPSKAVKQSITDVPPMRQK